MVIKVSSVPLLICFLPLYPRPRQLCAAPNKETRVKKLCFQVFDELKKY